MVSVMNTVANIRAEVVSRAERDRQLTEQIAQFLSDQNNDPMCRFYENQAAEIMAMVREADSKPVPSPYAVAAE